MAVDQGTLLKFEAISNIEIGSDEVAWEHIRHHLDSAEHRSYG